jgi:hypothetical protein
MAEIKKAKFGFVTDEMIEEVATINRLQMLLVRCGSGRFIAPAQDIKHFISCIDKSGMDHIRDVSFPAE